MDFITIMRNFMTIILILFALAIGVLMIFKTDVVVFEWSMETLLLLAIKIVGIGVLIGVFITLKDLYNGK